MKKQQALIPKRRKKLRTIGKEMMDVHWFLGDQLLHSHNTEARTTELITITVCLQRGVGLRTGFRELHCGTIRIFQLRVHETSINRETERRTSASLVRLCSASVPSDLQDSGRCNHNEQVTCDETQRGPGPILPGNCIPDLK